MILGTYKLHKETGDVMPFLPRDATHKRGICRHAVSVCLSVTFVDHVKMNKHIFEINVKKLP